MANEEGSNCLICHEGFLSAEVGALKCGHVYHRNCIVIWLTEKKKCPVCQVPSRRQDVRCLDFNLVEVPSQSPEEVRRLEAATLEERERRLEELTTEKAEAEAVAAQVEAELAELRDVAQEHKRARKDLEQEAALYKEDHLELSTQLFKATTSCSALRAGIDAEAPRLQRKLPVNQPREGDPDLNEERRKLRAGMRPADQARKLHQALASALQQENEKLRDKNQREAASVKAEDDLRDLRQQEAYLRRQLDERRTIASSQMSSQVSSQASTLPGTASTTSSSSLSTAPLGTAAAGDTSSGRLASQEARVNRLDRAGLERRDVVVEVATPHGGAELFRRPDDDDEDISMLYGGAPSRRPASGLGLLSRAAPPSRGNPAAPAVGAAASGALAGAAPAKVGGGKWGALFKSSGARPPAAATTPACKMAPGHVPIQSMKMLFANRRA